MVRMGIPNSSESKPIILVAVGHALYEPWKSILYEGQLKTWAPSSSKVIHLHAMPVGRLIRWIDVKFWQAKWNPKFGFPITALEIFLKSLIPLRIPALRIQELSGTTSTAYVMNIPDLDFLMNYKSLGWLTGILEQEFEYFVLTTSSSYINIDLLEKSLSLLPKSKLVAGRIENQSGTQFPSGSFRIFSRDILEQVAQNYKKFSKWRPEDLSIGILVKELMPDIEFLPIRSMDLNEMSTLEKLTALDLQEVVHFRLKSGSSKARNDVTLMHALHKKIRGN
jgi:hypothetical protein